MNGPAKFTAGSHFCARLNLTDMVRFDGTSYAVAGKKK